MGELIAAVVSKPVVEVSALVRLAVMVVVSVVLVSLAKVEGEEMSAELEGAG